MIERKLGNFGERPIGAATPSHRNGETAVAISFVAFSTRGNTAQAMVVEYLNENKRGAFARRSCASASFFGRVTLR